MKRSALLIVITALFALTITNCNSEEYDQVSIDVSDAGQAIEKYIYGQFIEHLGKCIYGGIWAEMVEDRKFYYPVNEDFDPLGTATDPFWGTGPYKYLKASPWEIIGKGVNVQMDRENPFTGEFAVRIKAPGGGSAAGIRQYGLGLIEGKKYSGHIILSGESSNMPVVVRLQSEGHNIDIPVEEIGTEFQTFAFEFESPFSSDSTVLEIFSEGEGGFTIGTLSLMPADNIKGW
ncbi:MAG: hypothetical protein E4H10_08860, partial [Bacteroidia bacterium]